MTQNRTVAAMRVVIAAIIALVLAAGGWLWMSPRWALDDLRDAARHGDAKRIMAYVDQQALRRSLADIVVDDMRRDYAGTADVSAMIAQQRRRLVRKIGGDELVRAVVDGPRNRKDATGVAGPGVTVNRTGVTTFVAGRNDARGRPHGVVFRLGITGWRITDVR